MGTPTLYIDGAEIVSPEASDIYNAVIDGLPHLIEVRGIDMTIATWTGLNWGSREASPFAGRIHSPLCTSNNTPADLDAARQFYVQNHGVTLA